MGGIGKTTLARNLYDDPLIVSHFDKRGWTTVFGEETCPSELENVGKRIAKNCSGLPLAIHVVGGLLAQLNRFEKSWENIADETVFSLYECISRRLEEAAQFYLDELVDRNLLLVIAKNLKDPRKAIRVLSAEAMAISKEAEKLVNLRHIKFVDMCPYLDIPYDEDEEEDGAVLLEDRQTLSSVAIDDTFPKALKVFPNLKKLGINFMDKIGGFPNLEILRLRKTLFESAVWEPREGGFDRLRLLQVPLGIGDILTLQVINVRKEISPSAVESLRRIQKDQIQYGNHIQVCFFP
ncbi:uncharacterized protein LOC127252941 [Andrographis paniculata]|uniref:uncharacterized protein LOC127252941 n=1 Tax=Andrographis paniculata TaxID=175694 RepID=UPI0021E8E1E6|nr:uncharacterized protein LOC127252941 [Andrographis paniculata]